MADTLPPAAPPLAPPSGDAAPRTSGGSSEDQPDARQRAPRGGKKRGTAGAGDAADAENEPTQPRASHGSKPPKAKQPPPRNDGGGEKKPARAAAGESVKERGARPKKPRERKPKPKAVNATATATAMATAAAAAAPPMGGDNATAAAATATGDKPVKKNKKNKNEARTSEGSAADGLEEAAESCKEPEEPEPEVDWSTASWFTGCDADLGTAHWLLTRCFACNDVSVLAQEPLVRRAVLLQKLFGRFKTELLPQDESEGNGEAAPMAWTNEAILSEAMSAFAVEEDETDGKSTKPSSTVVVLLEGEVVDVATELLISRVGREELALLTQWEAHLESLLPAAKSSASKLEAKTEQDAGEVEAEAEAAKETVEGEDQKPEAKETAAVLLPPLRQQRRRKVVGSANSVIVQAKAQVSAVIAFHKSYERCSSTVSSSTGHDATQWTAEIERIYESTMVGSGDEAARKSIAAQIQSVFRRSPQWRQCEVLLFGSSLSKFGSKASDLDLCLRANPAANDKDLEETSAKMSVRELRLRMRRMQKQQDGELPTADGSSRNDDVAFLKETLDKSLTTVKTLVNTVDKQRKKTKNRDATKLKRLQLLTAHWRAITTALEFFFEKNGGGAADESKAKSSKAEAKAAAAAYHAAIHKQQGQRQREIYAAAALLGRNGCDVDLVLSHARVPVIGFTHKASGFDCDLCFENYHACINTLLLRTYAEFDRRARALGIAIKHWAKQRGVNNASTGHLSSYSFILLVIFFLQHEARILPNLQHPDLVREAAVPVIKLNGVDVSFCNNLAKAKTFLIAQQDNHGEQQPETDSSSVGELLHAFFRFYIDEFDFSQCVISVRHPEQPMDKSIRWGKNKLKAWRISIEDPLEKDRDLGSVLQFRCQQRIIEEMKRALKLLDAGKSFEKDVCEASPESKANKPTKKVEGKNQRQPRGETKKDTVTKKAANGNGNANGNSNSERQGGKNTSDNRDGPKRRVERSGDETKVKPGQATLGGPGVENSETNMKHDKPRDRADKLTQEKPDGDVHVVRDRRTGDKKGSRWRPRGEAPTSKTDASTTVKLAAV